MKGLKDLKRVTEATAYAALLAVVTVGALLLVMSPETDTPEVLVALAVVAVLVMPRVKETDSTDHT